MSISGETPISGITSYLGEAFITGGCAGSRHLLEDTSGEKDLMRGSCALEGCALQRRGAQVS